MSLALNIRWFKTSDWTIPLLSHQGLEITPTQHRYKLWSGKQTSVAQKAAAVWMPNISALRAGGQNQCSIVCTGTTRQVVQPGTPKGDLQYLILLIIYSVISNRGKKCMFTTQDVKWQQTQMGDTGDCQTHLDFYNLNIGIMYGFILPPVSLPRCCWVAGLTAKLDSPPSKARQQTSPSNQTRPLTKTHPDGEKRRDAALPSWHPYGCTWLSAWPAPFYLCQIRRDMLNQVYPRPSVHQLLHF